jgi:hypothetical protein
MNATYSSCAKFATIDSAVVAAAPLAPFRKESDLKLRFTALAASIDVPTANQFKENE